MMRADYEALRLQVDEDGLLIVYIRERAGGQKGNRALHRELGRVWRDVDDDPDVRAVLITGEGKDFMPSVDAGVQQDDAGSFEIASGLIDEAGTIVVDLLRCKKPVVSAVAGRAGGAGLAVALLADICIVSREAVLADAHIRFGLAAGDHAAMLWPLLCGPAKAKYHLLTGTPLSGAEAERINLVARAVDEAQLFDSAHQIASNLARGPRHAIQWTKRTVNYWMQSAVPVFEASLAFEAVTFFGEEHREAIAALIENRSPRYI